MALALQSISIIIPIAKLKKSRDISDVDTFLREQRDNNDCWFDNYLFRYPAGEEQNQVMQSLELMKSQGFVLTRKYNGVEHWQDVCVVDAFSGPTLQCKWLEYDPEKGIVWYTGTDPGIVIG